MDGKTCCNRPMGYLSAEFAHDGVTLRIWQLLCSYCGAITEPEREVVKGRGPMSWLERHIEDRKVTEQLREDAPYYEANFPD